MRIYFMQMGNGELPAMTIEPGYRVVTVENGKRRTARKYDGDRRVFAHERWLTERSLGMGIWCDHPWDIQNQVARWQYEPTLDNLREEIRRQLVDHLRLLEMRVALVFVRGYGFTEAERPTHRRPSIG